MPTSRRRVSPLLLVVVAVVCYTLFWPEAPHSSYVRNLLPTVFSARRCTPDTCAYATVVCEGAQVPDVVALSRKLKNRKSKYPLLALSTPNVQQNGIDMLKKEGINVTAVSALRPPAPWQGQSAGIVHTPYCEWTRLHLFSLSHYRQIIYLKPDTPEKEIGDFADVRSRELIEERGKHGFVARPQQLDANLLLSTLFTRPHPSYGDLDYVRWFAQRPIHNDSSIGASPRTKTPDLKTTIVLPITSSNDRFCRSLFAWLVNGYGPPILLNWAGSSNHLKKVYKAEEWLLDLKPRENEIFLVADGFDVWPQLPASIFSQRYARYSGSPDVIWSAEKHCFPNPERGEPERCGRMPESTLPSDIFANGTDLLNLKEPESYEVFPNMKNVGSWHWYRYETIRPRYLNSGAVVGRPGPLLNMYSTAARIMPKVANLKHQYYPTSDQRVMMHAMVTLLDEGVTGLTTDTTLSLFQTMSSSYKEVYLEPYPSVAPYMHPSDQSTLAAAPEWQARKLAFNHASHTVPAVLHFAGPKVAMEAWWDAMWWSQDESRTDVLEFLKKISQPDTNSERLYGATLANGTWMSWNTLCSEYKDEIIWQ